MGEQPFAALPQFCFYAVISGWKAVSRRFAHLICYQMGDFQRVDESSFFTSHHVFPEGVDSTGVSLPDGSAIKSLDHFGWLATNCCRIKRCLAEDDLKRLTRVQGSSLCIHIGHAEGSAR